MTADQLTEKLENGSILQSVGREARDMNGMAILVIALCMVVLLVIACGVAYPFFPIVETYRIVSPKLNTSQRIVLLTDLHGCTHGKKNKKLLRMIREQEPDSICIAGDMTVKNGSYTDEVLALMQQLAKEFPVYYAPGNHEIRMPEYERYRTVLNEFHVHYLENQCIGPGGNVMIYGLDLPEYWYHKFWQKRELHSEDLENLLGNCRDECFSILLAHNPEYFPEYAKWGADLILSGHIHGGIMRLPILGGVISPSLRLFPTYDAGQFEEGGHQMIVSRGLGLHHIKLRFFNRPEISVINLTCQEGEK